MICVIGNKGNMGRRYEAILKYLQIPYVGYDTGDLRALKNEITMMADQFIIATPTHTHEGVIDSLNALRTNVEFLCEKPITTDNIEAVYKNCEAWGNRLYCVNQYEFITLTMLHGGEENSFYDYFSSGKDGLYWDCFQIFAMAKADVIVKNESPIWKCTINGEPISIARMDMAYIEMIQDFVGDKKRMWSKELVINTTKKIQNICAK